MQFSCQHSITPCSTSLWIGCIISSTCFRTSSSTGNHIRVDILGFTKTEREYYIKQELPDQPHRIKELTQYLHQHPSIDSICFIPFNMVVLLYLYKLGISLPKSSTELYHHFICSTICRHLSKSGNPLTYDITNLIDLPEAYNRIIQQLSKLSLAGCAAFWPLCKNYDTKFYTLHNTGVSCCTLHFLSSTKKRVRSY